MEFRFSTCANGTRPALAVTAENRSYRTGQRHGRLWQCRRWSASSSIPRSWLENRSESDILTNYPGLTREDILACLSYASYLAHEYTAFPIPPWKRLLADENFPKPIVEALRAEGHDVLWARTGATAYDLKSSVIGG